MHGVTNDVLWTLKLLMTAGETRNSLNACYKAINTNLNCISTTTNLSAILTVISCYMFTSAAAAF